MSACIQDLYDTPWKFNIAPEKLPSQKESSLPTIMFQGYVKLLGCIPVLQSVFNRWKGVPHNALALCCLCPEGNLNSPSEWRASWMVGLFLVYFSIQKRCSQCQPQLVSRLPCAFYSRAPATMSVNTRDATSKSGRWEQLPVVYQISITNQSTSQVNFWWC